MYRIKLNVAFASVFFLCLFFRSVFYRIHSKFCFNLNFFLFFSSFFFSNTNSAPVLW